MLSLFNNIFGRDSQTDVQIPSFAQVAQNNDANEREVVSGIQSQIASIVQQTEQSNNIGFGLGVMLRRLLGENDNMQTRSAVEFNFRDSIDFYSEQLSDTLGCCSNIKSAIDQKNTYAVLRFLNKGYVITPELFSYALAQHHFKACDLFLERGFEIYTEIIKKPIKSNNKEAVEYLIDINYISFAEKVDFDLLKLAIQSEAFDVAALFKSKGATLRKPVLGVVTDDARNGPMYRRTLDCFKDDLILITISASPVIEYYSEQQIIRYLENLPAGTNRAQAILNSGIEEVNQIKEKAQKAFEHCDAIWITGGVDVWSQWYASNQRVKRADDLDRDILEIALLSLQQKHPYKPTIGVCRGNQMINVFYGGSLQEAGERGENPLTFIQTKGTLGSALSSFSRGAGYSSHFQSIKRLGKSLEIVATNGELMPKAIQSKENSLPLMGTQFHPEMRSSMTDSLVLKRFLEAAQASKEQTCLAVDLNVPEPLGLEEQVENALEAFERKLLMDQIACAGAVVAFIIAVPVIVCSASRNTRPSY